MKKGHPMTKTDAHKAMHGGVSKKIAHLRHEGVPQKQAVAEALSMERAGRLTPEGGYIRKGKKR